ncbi:MAG: hypothetical protein AB1631_12105 [Acidobacteriota bacterium]
MLIQVFFLSFALIFAGAQTKPSDQTRRSNSNWMWNHSDDSVRLRINVNGRVKFADDYSDVTAITDGGSIEVTEERGGVKRRFEARSSNGAITRSYFVQGQRRPIDDEGRAWLKEILSEAAFQSGYDAPERVRRLMDEKGADAALAEISRLRSDYVRRIYFNELLKDDRLDSSTRQRAIRQAAREMSSDYEKAELLIKASEKPSNESAIIEGADSISSSYEKGRVLAALLRRSDLDRNTLAAIIRSATSISSDYEKAQFLIKAAEKRAVSDAIIEGADSISSDYEKGRVLATLLKKGGLDKAAMTRLIKSAARISSDYEKAQLLVKAAPLASSDEAIRNALVDAAKTIHSEYERGRVLSAVFK